MLWILANYSISHYSRIHLLSLVPSSSSFHLLFSLPPTLIISHSLVIREMSRASCHIVTAPPLKMMIMKAAKDT